MRRIRFLLTLALVWTILGAGSTFASQEEKSPMKKAVLLVAFGTSVPEAQKVFDRIDDQARKAFPEVEIRWAYTSRMIRSKLAKEGKQIDSPETALAGLMSERYTHVAVLSLHTIPGREFHDLYRNAGLFGQMAHGFEKIVVARPLLSSHDDMVRVAKGILAHIPADRNPRDAVLLMGHGSEHHPADAIYGAMNQVFQELDSNVYMGTVSGYPALEDLQPKLSSKESKKVYLMPFMLVAGDHAQNDMFGDDPDSWKSILTKNGFRCEGILKGTGEYPEIVEVWLDHLREVLSQF